MAQSLDRTPDPDLATIPRGPGWYARAVSDAPAPADPVPEPPRPGRPVGVHVRGTRPRDRHYVEYRYDVDGQTHTAKREMQWRRDGDQVWVVYDPDTPGFSLPQRM